MRTREIILLFYLIDMILLNGALMGTAYLVGNEALGYYPPKNLTIIFNVCWTFSYIIFINDMGIFKASLKRLLKNLASRFTIFFTSAALVIFIYEISSPPLPKMAVVMINLIFITSKIILSIFIFYWMSMNKVKGKSPILIIGKYKNAWPIFQYCKNKTYLGYRPLGILTDEEKYLKHTGVIGTLNQFQSTYDKEPFNDVIICTPLYEREKICSIITQAEKNGIRPRVIPNWDILNHKQVTANRLGEISVLDVRRVPLYSYPNRFWKRAFDLTFASMALLALLPLLVLLAIIIKLDSKGPVFYKPTRLGVNGTPFVIYKFRSMTDSDSAAMGTKSTVKNDSRITRVGKYLRKLNLDELPQLINVIKNEMSIVGPRPHRVYLNQKLKEKMNTYMMRHFIKPGITGWAQVNGWRGPTETRLQYKGRTLHDLWYVENWSFWMDIYIIYLTVFGKKVRKNAF